MKLDDATATHLLVRAGFSARPEERAPLVGKSPAAAVTALLAGMRTTAHTPAPPSGEGLFAFDAPPSDRDKRALLDDLADETGGDVSALRPLAKELFARLMQRGHALKAWWIEELATTTSPLTERVVLVLHNHFTSSLKKVRDPRLLFRQNALFRAHASGSYAELLHAVVDDPAMLLYLDAQGSDKDAPNENLARELLELFTLGEGHYGEADVKAAARALTGRRVRRLDGALKPQPRRRDAGTKRFLGREGDLGPHDLVDVLVAHPRTAETFVVKLWRELVDDTPDPARVRALAQTFRANGYRIPVLLEALLAEPAFWRTPGGLVRSPVDLVAWAARTYGADVESDMDPLRPEALARASKQMGQDLFDPPNVKGWPTGAAWATTTTIVARDRFLRHVGRALKARGERDAVKHILDPRVQTK